MSATGDPQRTSLKGPMTKVNTTELV